MAAWMYSPNIIRHKELDEIIAFRFRPGVAAPTRPSGALDSPLVLLRAYLVAARGLARPGLRRCRQGGLACPAGDRF